VVSPITMSLTNILLCLPTLSPVVWEAVYFGWAVENSSDIQPDTLHADTQGQSGPVFYFLSSWYQIDAAYP